MTGVVTADVGDVVLFDLGLVSDTGLDATDDITLDPTLQGLVRGDFGTNDVRVQFDADGDGVFEGEVIVAASGDAFSYDPRVADSTFIDTPGLKEIKWKTIAVDANGNDVVSATKSFFFTLEDDPTIGPVRAGVLDLERDTGTSDSDRLTISPILEGQIFGDFAGGTVRVEFDHDHSLDPNSDPNTPAVNGSRWCGRKFNHPLPPQEHHSPTILVRLTHPLTTHTGNTEVRYRLVHLAADGTELSTSDWTRDPLHVTNTPCFKWEPFLTFNRWLCKQALDAVGW